MLRNLLSGAVWGDFDTIMDIQRQIAEGTVMLRAKFADLESRERGLNSVLASAGNLSGALEKLIASLPKSAATGEIQHCNVTLSDLVKMAADVTNHCASATAALRDLIDRAQAVSTERERILTVLVRDRQVAAERFVQAASTYSIGFWATAPYVLLRFCIQRIRYNRCLVEAEANARANYQLLQHAEKEIIGVNSQLDDLWNVTEEVGKILSAAAAAPLPEKTSRTTL
jgi:hypothetical protein